MYFWLELLQTLANIVAWYCCFLVTSIVPAGRNKRQQQRRIHNPAKHLRWNVLPKVFKGSKPSIIFSKHSILDIWQCSEYASELYTFCSDPENKLFLYLAPVEQS